MGQERVFQPFEMERMMSKLEKVVEYNLSESGVHPITMRELVGDEARLEQLLDTPLDYPHANGIPVLRERIADLYPGASPDNILVTVGCAEANFLALQTLLGPGDEIVMVLPNYMQIWGLALNFGLELKTVHLDEDNGWSLDIGQLDETVSEKTKLIAVCNPNNPTGKILSEPEMDGLVDAATRVGAWLLADEVYSGAERVREEQTPTFWGRYDKVLAMGSLSKAYGLPGLRLGWAVAPVDTMDAFWARHEYLTIAATMLSNELAAIALSEPVRSRLLARTRGYIQRGYPILTEWLDSAPVGFSLETHDAAAIAFPKYQAAINSSELVDRLIKEKSLLVVPGDHFGLDHHLRVSFGLPPDYLKAGLSRIGELLAELTV